MEISVPEIHSHVAGKLCNQQTNCGKILKIFTFCVHARIPLGVGANAPFDAGIVA